MEQNREDRQVVLLLWVLACANVVFLVLMYRGFFSSGVGRDVFATLYAVPALALPYIGIRGLWRRQRSRLTQKQARLLGWVDRLFHFLLGLGLIWWFMIRRRGIRREELTMELGTFMTVYLVVALVLSAVLRRRGGEEP